MAQSDESALLVRMEASLAKFEKQMQAGYAAADKYANATEKRLGVMGKNVAKSAEASATAMVKELDALRAKYDPLFAASKQYEAELAQVDRAWKLGAISAAQHGAAIERLNTQYLAAQNVTNDLGDAALRGGDKMRMAAMQLSQVGQQTMASGNFIQALAIQLPDLGLAFGTVGAAAGLLGGVALPMLWAAMGSGSTSVEDIISDLDALEASLGRINELARIHSADGLQSLIEKYGEVDAALLQMIARQTEFEANQAMTRAREAVAALTEEYGVSTGQLNLFKITGEGAAADVAASLGLTKDAFVALQVAMQDVRDAKTFDEQADALGRMNDILARSTIATDELAGAALRAEDIVRQLSNAVPQASWMNAAIEGVNGLIGRLSAAVSLKNNLAGKISATGSATTKGQGVVSLPGTVDLKQDTGGSADVDLGKRFGGIGGGKGGGGGGGGKAQESIFKTTEDDLQRIQREIDLLGRSKGEVAQLKAEWALLDRAKERGLDLDKAQAGSSKTLRAEIEEQAKAVADLTMALEQQKLSQQAFEKGIDGIAGAMSEALVNGQSLRDGLASVFRGIAMDLAKSGIREGLMALIGGQKSGGFFGNLFSGLLGGTPSFDGGGWTGNGARAGGIDGKGGFPAILHPRETVIDTTKGGGQGAGGVITLNLRTDSSVIAEIAGNTSGMQIKTAMKQVPAIVAEHQKRKDR